MDLALNNLRWLVCNKIKPNQNEPNRTKQKDAELSTLLLLVYLYITFIHEI